MDATEVINSLGGTCKVAKLCGTTKQAVSNWKANGRIPANVILKTPTLLAIAIQRGLTTPKEQISSN